MEAFNAATLYSVEGMIAVITGGATGIGLMMTKTLLANGASRIYIVGRRQHVLEDVAKSLDPSKVIPLQGDVTSKSDLSRIAAHVAKESGYINLLITNSGAMGAAPPHASAESSVEDYASGAMDMHPEDFTQTMNVNATAVLWTAYAFLVLLEKGNRSSFLDGAIRSQILVTSSIAALHKKPGMSLAYKVSKAATSHLAKNMSTEFAPYDVRCNAIAPGLFQSDLAQGVIDKSHVDTGKKPWEDGAFDKGNIPVGRIGREQEMGGTVLYLTSRAGGYCNGTILVIDGGRLNTIPGY